MEIWCTAKEVSKRKDEPVRVVRYRCQEGIYPALKDELGHWRISPALFGKEVRVLQAYGVSHCVVAVIVPGEGCVVEHPLSGHVGTWFQWASGTPGIVTSRADSHRAYLSPVGGTSGSAGYLWVTTS